MSVAFEITQLQDASVLTLNDMKDRILINPDYQREGGVWNISKKQLFIDTLLNRYDVPKLYLHNLVGIFAHKDFDYSIIDGRQRLESIWSFLNNEFPMSADFEFLEDLSVNLAGKYFKEFVDVNPRLATRLYGRALTVMVVRTDDIDFVEDMFTRLNEAVPLNAAEKRNSFGGPLPLLTRELTTHDFLVNKIRVSPTRYRHHDLVAKMIWLNHITTSEGEFADTKKATLDTYYKSDRYNGSDLLEREGALVKDVLDDLATVFGGKDELLKSSGVLPVYFLLFQQLRLSGAPRSVSRQQLSDFEARRRANRQRFELEADEETDIDPADLRLIEYDELARSSNDASSIKSRLETLRRYLGIGEFEYEKPAAAT